MKQAPRRALTHSWLAFGTLLVGVAAFPRVGLGQPGQPSPGTTLFALDLSRTPVGELPANLDLTTGILEVALRNGVPMLKASALSEFRITLQPPGQVLPRDFTVEFDLVPKLGSNPQDLSVEGTPTINQGDASAHVLWHATGALAVIGGGGETYETAMPEDLQTTLPGVLTKVVLEVAGPTIRLYTNGRRLYTLQKQFARGAVLRVYLGAQNGGTEAVYLAGLRVTAGTGSGIAAGGGQQGGQLQQLKNNNPLPVVPSSNNQPQLNPPNRQQPQPQPQTASNQSGITGTLSPAVTPAVSVTTGPQGPIVDWAPVISPGVYTVQRWKIDDPLCCNNTSPASPPLTTPTWQDSWPPVFGTYVYAVTLTTNSGVITGQTQYTHASTGTPVIPAPTPLPLTPLQPQSPTQASPPPPPPPTTATNPIAGQAGLPTVSPSRPLPGSLGGNTSGLAPQNASFTGTPAWVRVNWAAPSVTIRGIVYSVDRYLESNPSCCTAKATGLGGFSWTDEGTQWAGTYVYRITAVYPDGSTGWLDARWVRPDPVNPSNFRVAARGPDYVTLQWDPVSHVSWYELFGPGLGSPSFQIMYTHITIRGLAPGTYSWQIGSFYASPNAPAPVSTAGTAFPQVTVTLP